MLPLFIEIVKIVLPVFLVVGLGYGIKRSALVDNSFLFQLNRLVYFFALPLLLFYKISTADFHKSFNGAQVIGLGGSVLLVFVLSYVFASIRRYDADTRGVFSQCAFRGNLAYVGLAIVFNAFGEEGLAKAGVLLGFIVPLLNLLAIAALLLPHQENRVKPFFFVQQIVFNPLIIASFLGILWSFLNLPVPLVIDRALHIVTGMALPLALISIGASFSLKKLRGEIATAFAATAFKLVIMPVLAAAVVYALGVRGQDLAVAVLFAGTPTATAAYIMTQQIRGDAELSGTIIMLTTLLSAFTYTVALMLIKVWGAV